jgi:aminoglycoside phosphotransferase (APT) family kinase protein
LHPDEVATDVALVGRLLVAQLPQWAGLAIEPVPFRGTDNALYRLGSDMVVRLPRRRQRTAALAKERLWLPRLAPHLPLAVPLPLANGTPGEGYPFEWSVYRWLNGTDATRQRVVDESAFATGLARFLAALQRVEAADGPGPGEHNVFRGEPLARRDSATRSAIADLCDSIDVDAVTSVWEAALHAPAWEHSPVWVHGDLDSRNLLVERGRLSAVIDWGCLGVGDPACDVAVAWKVLSDEARPVFRVALSSDDATWARACGWALSQALGSMSYYTLETNPTLVLEARRWLAEVLKTPAATRRTGSSSSPR